MKPTLRALALGAALAAAEIGMIAGFAAVTSRTLPIPLGAERRSRTCHGAAVTSPTSP